MRRRYLGFPEVDTLSAEPLHLPWKTGRQVGFSVQGLMGTFRPLFAEAEEGLLAAEEDAVIGEGEACAVAAHGQVTKLDAVQEGEFVGSAAITKTSPLWYW